MIFIARFNICAIACTWEGVTNTTSNLLPHCILQCKSPAGLHWVPAEIGMQRTRVRPHRHPARHWGTLVVLRLALPQ